MKEKKINIKQSAFNLLFDEKKNGEIPIVFLHGFTGSADDWLFIFDKLSDKVFPLALDLPGHGKSINLENEYYNIENFDEVIIETIKEFSFEKIILVGYSMGGRIAYQFAVKHPEILTGLIIESATPGLAEQEAREERFSSDFQLSEQIKQEGINSFIEYWFSLPIFNTLHTIPPKQLEKIKNHRKLNSPEELARALVGGSQGKVKHVWDKLSVLSDNNIPLLLIDGEADKKYRFLDTLVLKEINNAERKTVKRAGHNIHLEKPEEFIILVNSFIDKVLKEK